MAVKTGCIKIMIADDHALLRAALKILLNTQEDMEVVSEAPDGGTAIQAARETKPDVALLDLTMPGGGLKALQEIVRTCSQTRVLVLTMHEDPVNLRAAMAAGASGYLSKKAADTELIAAIHAVHSGGTYLCPRMTNYLVQDAMANTGSKAAHPQLGSTLSSRELQVLGLVARGYSSAEIAKQIYVGVKTVETYRVRLNEKLGLHTRHDVVRVAMEMGLLTSESVESNTNGM
jgi:two-component system response regulator NreC